MTTNFLKNSVDIDTIFEPIGSSTKRADVGYQVSGTDISNTFYSLTEGGTSPANTGFQVGGSDLANYFAEVGTISIIGNDANTVFLADFIGDIGSTGHEVTVNGNPVLTEIAPTGFDGSALCNGTSDLFNVGTASQDFDLETGDWTIRFWVKPVSNNQLMVTIGEGSSNTFMQISCGWNYANYVYFIVRKSGSWGTPVVSSSGGLTVGAFNYVALINTSGTLKIYVNGTEVGSGSADWDSNIVNKLYVGGGSVADFALNYRNAYYSDFEIAKVARSTDVPTKPLVSDEYTKILLPFSGNIGVGSSEVHNITIVNTGLFFSQEAPTGFLGSWKFDGTDDYAMVPDSTDWDIAGSAVQDYTIDFWVKHTDHAGIEYYVSQYVDGNNLWGFFHNNGNGIRFFVTYGGTNIVLMDYGGEITDTNWHHICLVKKTDGGSNVYWGIYKDSVQVSYLNDTSITGTPFTGLLTIGRSAAGSSYFDGNMAMLRIQKSNWFNASPNVGLTDTITVPTEPYTKE